MHQIKKILIDRQEEKIITDNRKPVISWNYSEPFDRIQKQYRILVSLTDYKGDTETVWDSGYVESEETIGIEYDGADLKSAQKYMVSLETILDDGSSLKGIKEFETAYLDPSDWKGKTIAMPANWSGGTELFRRQFTIPEGKTVYRAKAYVLGLGYHEVYLNGKKISDGVLNPGFTDYNKRTLYCVYDMEGLVVGENVIGIELGYGWYGNRKLKADFIIEFTDGTIQYEYSDEAGWWVGGSPTTYNSIFGGETYDATLENVYPKNWTSILCQPNWDNGWMFPMYSEDVPGVPELQTNEPIRICKIFPEVSRKEFAPNSYLLDIGHNIAGWLRIKIKGKRGTKITIKYGEDIKDGHTNQLNLRSAKATDTYILSGEDIEEFAPRFTYHGFRYADLLIDGEAELISFQGEHVHSDTKIVGSFKCSDEKLNYLHEIAALTEHNNEHSILTDCPQRDERCGWLNDLGSRIYQSMYNVDLSRLFPKFIHDITTSQRKDGAITDTAPYLFGGCPADPVCVAYLLFSEYMYRYYGDKTTIIREYDHLKAWTEFLLSHSKDYIMDYYYYADWVPPYPDNWAEPLFVSSCYLNWHLQEMEKIARIAGNKVDEDKYHIDVEKSKASINKTYYKEDKGYYCKNHQSENAIAVSLGICEEKNRKLVVSRINQDIIDRGYHFTSGNIGYRHVFYMLGDYGYHDTAIKVLENPEYPGWGYMVKSGATSVWERWESEMSNTMDSFDHPMFGSYDAFLYRYIGGILIKEDSFASNDVEVSPVFPEKIDYCESSLETPRGKIVSNWKREGEKIIVHIEAPYGTKCIFKAKNESILVNQVLDLVL